MTAPYYEAAGITIYHGDCLDVLPQLAAVDLIVTSPPYNLGHSNGFGHWRNGDNRGGGGRTPRKWGGAGSAGIGYDRHDDAMPPAVYEVWQRQALTACWDRLTDRGAIYYNHRPRIQADGLWLPLTLNPGLPLRQIIIWTRAGGLNLTPTAYAPAHEWILVLAKPGFRLRDRAASGITDVWYIPQQPSADHPAPFPLGLPARAIETTRPAIVLDPFMGSGTTLRAAVDAGIRAIGIDISERYCEIAARRLDQGVLTLTTAHKTDYDAPDGTP